MYVPDIVVYNKEDIKQHYHGGWILFAYQDEKDTHSQFISRMDSVGFYIFEGGSYTLPKENKKIIKGPFKGYMGLLPSSFPIKILGDFLNLDGERSFSCSRIKRGDNGELLRELDELLLTTEALFRVREMEAVAQ